MAKKTPATLLKEEIKELKSELKELRLFKKDVEKNDGKRSEPYPHIAMSVINVDGKYKLVEVGFDLDKEESGVVSYKSVGANDSNLDIARFEASKYLVEVMFKQ